MLTIYSHEICFPPCRGCLQSMGLWSRWSPSSFSSYILWLAHRNLLQREARRSVNWRMGRRNRFNCVYQNWGWYVVWLMIYFVGLGKVQKLFWVDSFSSPLMKVEPPETNRVKSPVVELLVFLKLFRICSSYYWVLSSFFFLLSYPWNSSYFSLPSFPSL